MSWKTNVLSKILIPRIAASIRYILTELEEMEREEIFRLKRVKQNKIRDLKHAEEVGAGENTKLMDKPSEMKVTKSVVNTTARPPDIEPPAAEGGDPLIVIKPPESGETGEAFKSTQQFQTIKPEKEIKGEEVEKKQEFHEPVEKTEQGAKIMSNPETGRLLMSSDALSLVSKIEEPEETFARKSKSSLNKVEALQDGNSVNIESTDHKTPGTVLEENNKNNIRPQKFSKTSLGDAGESHKEQLEKMVDKSKIVSIQTLSQPKISESFEEIESFITSPKEPNELKETSKTSLEKITLSVERPNGTSLETSTLTDLSSNREIENKLAVKIQSSLSDEIIKDADKIIAEKTKPTGIDEKVPSDISSTISQPKTIKLFEEGLSPDILSDNDLNQEKNTQAVEDSALSRKKQKETSIENEVSKNEVTKSKSSVRIKLPEDKNDEESQSRSDENSTAMPSDKNKESKNTEEIKELVQTHEKMTEGSIENLGEGDNRMYTGQSQNVPDKIQLEHDGSVEGIVDAEPYFETASVSKPSVSGPEGGMAGKSVTESNGRIKDYYEADIELDETDVDISTSRVANSTEERRDRSNELDGPEPEEESDDPRIESNVDGKAKRSAKPDDKNRQT